MIFRAVFCDIDGTLLDSSHRLRPATIQAIRALGAAGVPFIPVSARSPGGVYPIQKELGVAGPIVSYGGALVMGADTNPVHSLPMEMSRAVALKERIKTDWPDVTTTVYAHDSWYVENPADARVTAESAITGVMPTAVRTNALTTHSQEAHKLFCVGLPDDIAAMQTVLARDNAELAVTRSNPFFLEIMNGKATKSNALRYVCEAMRILPREVVAFGDNYNDLDMLESAGLGIAMGNAPAEVKSRAGRVTADNDHEGVLQALHTLNFSQLTNSTRFERASFHRL